MHRTSLLAWTLAVLWLAESASQAGDWPHWRGPTRDGLTKESSEWTSGEWISSEPKWRVEIGVGASSPLIYRDRVYLIGWESGHDVVYCLSLSDGKVIWTQRYQAPSHGRFHKGEETAYGGPSSTPEIDTETGLMYSLGADGDLKCWDLSEMGRNLWSLNLHDGYDVKQRPKLTPIYHRDYGYTTSPLVFRNSLIVEVGSPAKGSFVAFDKKTGRELWRSTLKDEAGHSGGLAPIEIDGVPCIVGFTQRHVAVIRIDDAAPGATIAQVPWITEGDCNLATPTVVGKSILVTSAYNQNAIARFNVDLQGMKEVWRKPLPSKVCSPVVHDGAVYYSWMKVHCLNWNTGELLWTGGSYGDAGSCVVTADGRLIVYGHDGKLGLIEGLSKSPNRFKELFVRNRIFDATAWPHVAIGSHCVLCRDKNGNLSCFSTAKAGGIER